jgi:anti-sigma regulatory factor (Ser/Thr protein kinase)
MNDQRRPGASGQARAGAGGVPVPPARDGRPGDRTGAPVVPVSARSWPGAAGQWPLRDVLELQAWPGAIPFARRHTRDVLVEWGLRDLAENSELVVTELVANAVAASRQAASPVRLWLVSDWDRVLIVVWDAVPTPPDRVSAGCEAESGRGLMLVDALSEQWGWCPGAGNDGKFVWAAVR